MRQLTMLKIKEYSLYLVMSEEFGNGRSAFEIATSAIAGGVDILQMREKDKFKETLVALGNALSQLCREKNVIFIVNDDPYLAQKVNADGVHLGQEDIKQYGCARVRDIIGHDKIIGVSTHSREQFDTANISDVDYIAYGPIFSTKTKNYSIGTADITTIVESAKKPVFLIGGINLFNIDKVLQRGGKNIALIRGIAQADDIESAVRLFKEKLTREKLKMRL